MQLSLCWAPLRGVMVSELRAVVRWNTLPQYLVLSVSGGATRMVGNSVSGCGVGHVQLLLQYLTLSVVEGTDDEQAVGKLDVLLQ